METLPAASSVNSDIFQSPDSRWLALTHRNPSSHSSFVYGVKSTKVYCRPTCPARLARRANVVFYDTEDQARQDGYRPCRRCQPDNVHFMGEKEEIVIRVLALLHGKNGELTAKRKMSELAMEVGVTRGYLCRVFKKTMGITLGTYMMEFERNPNEVDSGGSLVPSQYSNEFGSGVVDPGAAGFLTAASGARCSLVSPGTLPVEADLVHGQSMNGRLTGEDLHIADGYGLWTMTC